MTLTPNFLPVGSLIQINLGSQNFTDCEVKIVDWYVLKQCQQDNDLFNTTHRPIPLTPEILTEWCNAKKDSFLVGQHQWRINDRLFVIRDGKICDYGSSVQLDYLHELQLLFLGFKTVLPITIK